MDEIQAQVVEYAVVVDGVEIRHLELEETQMVYGVGYVGRLLGSGTVGASSAAQQNHDVKVRIHRRRHHHRPSCPSH